MIEKHTWESSSKNPVENFMKTVNKIRNDGYLHPKELSEKTEFLSRQHMDFKTLEGMKQILQSVTWRVKVEEKPVKVTIYVRKKKIPEARRLAKEFGNTSVKYDVKEIGWFECWFKRFKVVEERIQGVKLNKWCAFGYSFTSKNKIIHFDLAKDDDYSAKATFKKKRDGSLELIDIELGKQKKKSIPKFISKGQGKTPTGEKFYFVEDPEKLLKVDKMAFINGKVFKVKEIVNKKGNPLTRVAVKFI